ncbi:unnamed protein product [Nesidiocoris tenuis]|uniref:BTB domain-containing protein n=1 Tax=Nesidiocoris tenuis TaxID=355587 RepID=A0A6H5GJB6_9HEMI|nr:unnamed protein product [Nesidiocoris tenuis]
MANHQQQHQQQYCLRWNNHRSNLLTVFDQLLQNEAFTDVTLACEGGTSMKCHKMVLAACSSYFQCLFTELPCRHPVVVLKDVKYCEMKAILEYMYRGEVNVAQNQLAALLKVAEALKVKGLVEENGGGSGRSKREHHQRMDEEGSNAAITTTSNQSALLPASSSCGMNNSPDDCAPPHSTSYFASTKIPYSLYGKSPIDRNRPLPPSSTAQSIGSAASAAAMAAAAANFASAGSPDLPPPLRRKKFSSSSSSILMSKDTPILRTVLGQGQADSSQQPVALVCRPDRGIQSGIANYVATSRPEWKRYKQYTRNDIMSAIEAVKQGMSALKAANKYGVPSRTLYDKVKKLGITTGRPIRRSSNSNRSPAFQYGFPGSGSVVYYGSNEDDNKFPPNVVDQSFLHQVLDAQNIKREDYEREAIAALVAASSNPDNTNTSGNSSSPPRNHERSPSPNLIKYAHRRSPSPVSPQQMMEEDSNQVEDLSVSRKSTVSPPPPPPPPSRVIMPPMSQAPTAMVTTGVDQHDGSTTE